MIFISKHEINNELTELIMESLRPNGEKEVDLHMLDRLHSIPEGQLHSILVGQKNIKAFYVHF